MPDHNNQFQEKSDAIQSHLNISQSVINRMANNSASCKGWCIAIVSAILVVVADKSKQEYSLIALMPVILFMILDAYYLVLEKRFRISYNEFIEKLHSCEISSSDLFVIIPSGSQVRIFSKALLSFSVWPFYLMLIFMVGIACKFIL